MVSCKWFGDDFARKPRYVGRWQESGEKEGRKEGRLIMKKNVRRRPRGWKIIQEVLGQKYCLGSGRIKKLTYLELVSCEDHGKAGKARTKRRKEKEFKRAAGGGCALVYHGMGSSNLNLATGGDTKDVQRLIPQKRIMMI